MSTTKLPTGPVRSNSRRSATRSAHSKPYARPVQHKKSAWSIATGLLSFLNPLKSRPEPTTESSEDEEEEPEVERAAPQNLSARGRQMAQTLSAPVPEPLVIPTPYMLPDSSSPQKNLETVASFLEQRRGQTITPLEAEGLISLIHKSTPSEKPEPFRFSSSASLPSTPARGNSPVTPTNDLFTMGASSSTPATGSPRKTLSKNPNGVYRWSGAGSARPSKNRYASPAFGTPSRASSPHLVFRDSPVADTSPKRRRLETPSPATPPPIPRSAAPAPSPNRVSSQVPLPTPAPPPATPNRAITKVKSVPVVPSPLRQAWGSSPASSASSNGSSPVTGTPTKAASLLSALIRDVDAEIPKRFDEVRNPYQAASPVNVRVTNTHPPDNASRKRTRIIKPAEKVAVSDKEKESIPPQAIIEATMPKGSKRSRPPPNLNGNGTRRFPHRRSNPLPAAARDSDLPATKRARPNGNGVSKEAEAPAKPTPVSVFPVSNSAPSLPLGTNNNSFTTSSLPSSSSSSDLFRAGPKPLANVPREPSKLRHSFAPPPTPPPPVAEKQTPVVSADAKDVARALAASELPTFVFSAITNNVSSASHAAARDAARSLIKSALPKFDFAPPSADKGKGKTTEGFNWGAAGVAPPKAAEGKWKCTLCSLDNDADVVDKCKICEAPRAAPPKAPASKGFDWAAAGAKKPDTAPADVWMCGLCGLKNPATATEKCGICDAPR
ncbi:E3 sumo-protein ligase 2-like protein [Mycena chlorophos]|uniref:E3 sumo-protein ligase 2-like protein n=1 Tax=Mycena chlorophos TaxID=658473 RepID=A0A8H6VTI1_MYCCL|nr:E3 sumo-protein ligase 2-like protein [Mycena chlorophos]